MASLNRATIIGNLGKDPEIRTSQNGNRMAMFSVATTDRWKDKVSGEKRERTEWHKVVVFNEGLAGIAEKYLQKGSRVLVEGELRTRKWQDKLGQERYSTDIVLNGFNAKIILMGGNNSGGYGSVNNQHTDTSASTTRRQDDLDDDIPF